MIDDALGAVVALGHMGDLSSQLLMIILLLGEKQDEANVIACYIQY